MLANTVHTLLNLGARIGSHPQDSDDVRLQKSMLVMSCVMFIAAGLLWGLMYFALGGNINGSAVVLWAIIAPVGALVFDEPRRAPAWFVGYLALVILSGPLQPYVRQSNQLSAQQVVLFFVLNIGAVSGIVFILLYTFVRQRNALLALLAQHDCYYSKLRRLARWWGSVTQPVCGPNSGRGTE